MIYSQELRTRIFKAYEDELSRGIIFQQELEEQMLNYYRTTTPSLQEYYSRYTPEWEAFYASEGLPVYSFLTWMKQMRNTFRKRYELTELNVDYYINRLEKELSVSVDAAVENKEFFLDQWHRLLTRKEYDYQYMHIETLCQSFGLLARKRGKQSGNRSLERVEWLLHNYPDLYRRIVPYEQTMNRHAAIRQLVALLGKRQRKPQCYDAFSGIDKRMLIRHSLSSDIVGITQGNDLSHLLPVEYCYLSDERLRSVFLERYAEKRLQQFDCRSKENDCVHEGKQKVSGQGPYIVCVDTSGSMQGEREKLAKSAILAIAHLTEKTHRKCYVINFSDEAVALSIGDLGRDMPRLAEFLDLRWDGGTDISPALREAAHIICGNDYRESDVILISDFEMPPLSDKMQAVVQQMKRRKTSFFALVFGNRPEMEYLGLCERYWEM